MQNRVISHVVDPGCGCLAHNPLSPRDFATHNSHFSETFFSPQALAFENPGGLRRVVDPRRSDSGRRCQSLEIVAVKQRFVFSLDRKFLRIRRGSFVSVGPIAASFSGSEDRPLAQYINIPSGRGPPSANRICALNRAAENLIPTKTAHAHTQEARGTFGALRVS